MALLDIPPDRRAEGGDTVECTKVNCPMQAGTPTDNCSENCPWRTITKRGDLISRAAAIEAAIDGADVWDGGYNPERERCIREYMAKVSAVDAVSVVRCRDCKFYYGVNEECGCNGG